MSSITPPQFGEEGGRLSYGSYIRVPDLLALQTPLAEPPAHDEHLFIVIHQVYELWFKQLLHDLTAVRDELLAGRTAQPLHLLTRAHAIERVLVEQVDVLETMSPNDFLAFRANLAPASGFQSVQFREIEILSGEADTGIVSRLATSDEERARVAALLASPTIWDAFCGLLAGRGLDMSSQEVRRESLLTVLRDRDRLHAEHALSEALLQHDELFALWRYRHVLMVERQIGTKSGTGGSAGAPYLRNTLSKRFYPELWELRSYL